MNEPEILRAEIQRLNVQRDTAWGERDALRAEVESLRAENDALNHEIMGYQVDDGYQKGYDHAQATAASEILRLRVALREAAGYKQVGWGAKPGKVGHNGRRVCTDATHNHELEDLHWEPLYRRVTPDEGGE